MISSIGVDLVEVSRILRLYDKFGARFLARAFHPREAAKALQLPRARLGTFLAARWAAKEALHKALRSERLLFPDVEVVSCSSSGAPSLLLHNQAAAVQQQRGLVLHLSLSHEGSCAVGFVVAEAAQLR